MPRHPPYTLKSLATVTDHRHARAWHDAGRARACAARSGTGPSFVLRRKRCSTTPHPGHAPTGRAAANGKTRPTVRWEPHNQTGEASRIGPPAYKRPADPNFKPHSLHEVIHLS